MNAERLLAYYEQIADAPEAVTRLRRVILDLAVRGKLVPQDANDEPVAKRYLNELGASELPANWRVLNFGKFCDIEGGNQPPKSQFIDEPREGYVQLFQIRDLGERGVPTYIPIESARSLSKEGDILIGRYGASVGKVFWAQNGAYNVAMAKFIWPHDAFISDFAFLLLKSDFLQGPLANATRSAQAGFNKGDLAAIDFPLPPLAEQYRIVAKIDELMALCDQLEAARRSREAVRDQLAAAGLARLNAPDPETFQTDARFALDALAAFTVRPDQIKQLRQTILNLAIRGMLVPQDPNDEPIPLLTTTRLTSAILPGDGNRRTEGKQASLPSGWIVARGELAADFIDRRYTLQKGDFVIGKIGTIGDPVFLEAPFNYTLSANLMLVQPKSSIVAPAYLFVFFESPIAIAMLQLQSTDSTHAVFGIKKARELLIPLPPLAEQHRIVAKVDTLMALCDRLEASLTSSDATRRSLLDALLAEALAPAEDRELEAAE